MSLTLSYPWHRLRSAQYEHIYVSPHMDDAAYSCGGQIALARRAGARVLVLTVFGNGAGEQPGRGVFGDVAQRKREEEAAMARLDADFLWLDHPEALCRPKRPRDLALYALSYAKLASGDVAARLYAALGALLPRLLAPGGDVCFPLGIGFHPDHRILHELGRMLRGPALPVRFYEDVPYAQVESLRRDRLRYLGHQALAPTPLGPSTRAIDALVFPHAPRWQRPVTRLLVGGHLAGVRALFRLRPARRDVIAPPQLVEHDIAAVITDKVEAMRAYATQTAHFFPDPDALYEVLRDADGRYVERSWRFAAEPPHAAPSVPRAYEEAERARVDALLDSVRTS